MTGAAKRKGDKAERECAELIATLIGGNVKRALGAGRAEDTGDIYGVPDTAIQVANWADLANAVRTKPGEAEQQRVNAGATFAATFCRIRGGRWVVAMTPEQWATYHRGAMS